MRKLSQAEWIAIAVGVVVIFAVFYVFTPLQFSDNTLQSPQSQPNNNGSTSRKVLESGLIVDDRVIGQGAEATNGSKVSVHYVGRLLNGKQFDSSIDRDTPFTFTLGKGDVIAGWDEGVVGMRVGGRRVLIIPPELGYGSTALSSIPANSTLVFEVVLLDVK